MDIIWQYDNPPNPADAQDGPQTYDDHLYYSFGVSYPVHIFDDALLILVATGCR